MVCKICKSIPDSGENEDCFEKALNVLKRHYVFCKSAMHQRNLELQQVKERNEQLNKALKLLQTTDQPTKRFKSQNSDSWLDVDSLQEERLTSEHSLTDDEVMPAANLNMALNSQQLFDTSLLNQTNNISRSFTEMVQSPTRLKQSPKRNKQHDAKRCLKDRNNIGLQKRKTEWHSKERNSPVEQSWTHKFLPLAQTNTNEAKMCNVSKKLVDKKLSLTLKKTNPSKMKQSLIHFSKPKESDSGDDIIDASPVVAKSNTKAARSWSHRSVQNCQNLTTNETVEKHVAAKILDDIVFDFSPSKKTDPSQSVVSRREPKSLEFNSDSAANFESLNLAVSTNKSDSSSVVILTPGTEDIIFVEDDTDDNVEQTDIDTMDLLADNLEKLKKYESKCLVKPVQATGGLETFKMPSTVAAKTENRLRIKHEPITQENLKVAKKADEETPSCSKDVPKHLNPLLSSDDTEDDEDFMPQPFLIKQEHASESTAAKQLSLKQRFKIEEDCEDCKKLIAVLDKKLTDAEIQQHLDKCKRHNNPNFMRQNTPKDFWNPFILSFQADDPRNEVLIDNRFKDIAKNN